MSQAQLERALDLLIIALAFRLRRRQRASGQKGARRKLAEEWQKERTLAYNSRFFRPQFSRRRRSKGIRDNKRQRLRISYYPLEQVREKCLINFKTQMSLAGGADDSSKCKGSARAPKVRLVVHLSGLLPVQPPPPPPSSRRTSCATHRTTTQIERSRASEAFQ